MSHLCRLGRLGCLVLAGLLLAADDPKKVPDTIKGNWKLVEQTIDGKTEKAREGRDDVKFLFSGDKITASRNGDGEQWTYKLDIAKTPIAIDIAIESEKMELKGIVEVDGDSLKLCFARPGIDRPADFAAKERSQHVSLTFKREKK